MILVYIISFSVLITSGIFMTDVLFTADKKLEEVQQRFIQKTRSFHKKQNDQKGSITLMGASLTLIFSFLFMYLALKMKVELKEAHYRKDTYLCFQSLNVETQSYIDSMAKFNWALRSLYIAGLITPKAKAAFKAIKMARDLNHFLYLKNLLKNKYCKGINGPFSYLKNFPFKTIQAFFLQTNPDATTILRSPKWRAVVYKKPQGIREEKAFCLLTEFEAEGPLKPNLKIKTFEYATKGFSKLKCLSGFL